MSNPYNEDFFIRHRQLHESSDNVVLIYGGMSYGVKSLVSPQKFDLIKIKRTKLLRSKSKQSRIVSVVCK